MWYYVSSACADPGIFAKGVGGGGGGEGVQAHLTEKAPLSVKTQLWQGFLLLFYSPYLHTFKQFYRTEQNRNFILDLSIQAHRYRGGPFFLFSFVVV